MAVKKLSVIPTGGAVAGATDTCVAVRSGTTDVLVTPVTLDLAQVFLQPQGVTLTAIGTAATSGFKLLNSTAAAPGAQQYSPALQLSGQGWKTTATAASQQCDWQIQCVPVQGT